MTKYYQYTTICSSWDQKDMMNVVISHNICYEMHIGAEEDGESSQTKTSCRVHNIYLQKKN